MEFESNRERNRFWNRFPKRNSSRFAVKSFDRRWKTLYSAVFGTRCSKRVERDGREKRKEKKRKTLDSLSLGRRRANGNCATTRDISMCRGPRAIMRVSPRGVAWIREWRREFLENMASFRSLPLARLTWQLSINITLVFRCNRDTCNSIFLLVLESCPTCPVAQDRARSAVP